VANIHQIKLPWHGIAYLCWKCHWTPTSHFGGV